MQYLGMKYIQITGALKKVQNYNYSARMYDNNETEK